MLDDIYAAIGYQADTLPCDNCEYGQSGMCDFGQTDNFSSYDDLREEVILLSVLCGIIHILPHTEEDVYYTTDYHICI